MYFLMCYQFYIGTIIFQLTGYSPQEYINKITVIATVIVYFIKYIIHLSV